VPVPVQPLIPFHDLLHCPTLRPVLPPIDFCHCHDGQASESGLPGVTAIRQLVACLQQQLYSSRSESKVGRWSALQT
jgi:hypothetical protein